jgi:D-ribitol-5-phosphate cytidylyltransferase
MLNMNTCIILAGGVGIRASFDIPKQFMEIEGKPLFCYSTEIIDKCNEIDFIIIVSLAGWEKYVDEWVVRRNIKKVKYVVNEGVSRQHSIFNGLQKAREFMNDSDIIMIHDSARPMISGKIIENAIATALVEGSAIPVVKTSDALYLSDDGKYAGRALPKSSVYLGQTPVCFNFGMYYKLNIDANYEDILKSYSSCDLLFQNGIKVAMIKGDPKAFKITYKEDLEKFKEYLEYKNLCI